VIASLYRLRSGHADKRRAQQLDASSYFLLVAFIVLESSYVLAGMWSGPPRAGSC